MSTDVLLNSTSENMRLGMYLSDNIYGFLGDCIQIYTAKIILINKTICTINSMPNFLLLEAHTQRGFRNVTIKE